MQRLELTWIGKGQEPEVEPRILLHDPSKDYGDPNSENMLFMAITSGSESSGAAVCRTGEVYLYRSTI